MLLSVSGDGAPVNFIRGLSVKTLMTTLMVVKLKIGFQAISSFRYRVIGIEVDFFVFDAFPGPFNDDVINPSPFSIHADLDLIRSESVGEFCRCELTALVRVENPWGPVSVYGFVKRIQSKSRVHGVRQSP